jgi:probable rRNA maturation factor
MTAIIENEQGKVSFDLDEIRKFLGLLMDYLGISDHYLSLLIVDDHKIRELNRTFLHKDEPTNVLSFPMNEGDASGINPEILGDIVISAEAALREAKANGLTTAEQINFYILHGLLHLSGYDHERGDEAEACLMQQKEREIFLTLTGIELATP